MLFADDTLAELSEVLSRPKFGRYISAERRRIFLAQLSSTAEFIPIVQIVRECQDPKDDKFLEVGLNGGADLIVTGDADLLGMNAWRGIEILPPAEYLNR